MNKKQAAQEIAELTKKINYYNKQFFQYHRSLISDYAFDQLVLRLTALEQQFPELKQPNSPTQRVGEKLNKAFPTIKHTHLMRSLGNTYSIEELKQFDTRIHKLLGEEKATYFCELKFDGVAISIRYHNGDLQYVVTRGDGTQGDDITANGRTITSIPSSIADKNIPPFLEVRGEAFMTKEAFYALNEKHTKEGKPTLANPRNTTSGTLKTLDSNLVAERELSFCPYTLIADNLNLPTQASRIDMLEKWGFFVSPTYRMCPSIEGVIDYIKEWEEKRDSLPMEIDGVVIKVNEIAYQKQLGATNKSPRWAIAYKYKPQNTRAFLEEVIYQVGRTGVITPVAKLTPTRLAGSTIQRASLHNSQEIATLDLHTEDTILLEKGGDVIPKVIAVDLAKRKAGSQPIQFITKCPSCHTSLIKEEDGAHHYCPNHQACPWQLQGKLNHFVHRQAMNIAHIGGKTISLLFEKNIIQRPVDLYALTESSFSGLEGFQEKSIHNILSSIEASKHKPFAKVLFALGIRHIGSTVAQKLVQHFGDIDSMSKASEEALIAVPEVGPQIAHSLLAYFQDHEEMAHLTALRDVGIQLSQDITHTNDTLAGKSFVITGTFTSFSREDMRSYIQNHGGRVVSALSSQVDYLVAGNNAGPTKITKADKLGTTVIDEQALQKIVTQ